MRRCVLLGLIALGSACNKPPSLDSAPAASEQAPAQAGPAAADMTATLAELTQALRKYSVEQRKVPASLSEVAAAGYIQKMPQPPPGKTFAIDQKNVKVVLK